MDFPSDGHGNHQLAEVLLNEEAIARRVRELAEGISTDYAHRNLLLVAILKGAFIFVSDLIRELTIPVHVDFMAVSSYGAATVSSGVVRILKDLEEEVEGRDVMIVEDIVDSGLTLAYLYDNLQRRGPASLEICVLLDKVEAREKEVPIAYRGFEVPDTFVVGYGIDVDEDYRQLPYIASVRRQAGGGTLQGGASS